MAIYLDSLWSMEERRLRYSYAHADPADVLEAGTLETRKRDCAGWTRGFGENVSRKANYESEGTKKEK